MKSKDISIVLESIILLLETITEFWEEKTLLSGTKTNLMAMIIGSYKRKGIRMAEEETTTLYIKDGLLI